MITHTFDYPREEAGLKTIRIVYSKPVMVKRDEKDVEEIQNVFHERLAYNEDYEIELTGHVEEMKGVL
jgi:hypothetical protein